MAQRKVKYLSQEWLDEVKHSAHKRMIPKKGNSARIQYHIPGAPQGDVHYYELLVDGVVEDLQLGEITDDITYSITIPYKYAAGFRQGKYVPEDYRRFEQDGTITVTGSKKRFLDMMTGEESPQFKEHLEYLRSVTEY